MVFSTLQSQVLIVGAGPTGLSMGIALAQQGIQSKIIEKRSSPTKTSNAVLLKPSILSLFDQLNVIEAVLEEGHILDSIEYFCNRKYITGVRFQNSILPYPFCISLPQNITEEILIKRYLGLGGQLLWNHELIGIKKKKEGVEGTLLLAPNNTYIHFETRFLVAADGSQSKTCELLQLHHNLKKAKKQSFFIADVMMHWKMPSNTIHTFFTRQSSLSIIKLPKEYARIIADVTSHFSAHGTPSLQSIQTLIKEATPFKAILSQPLWSTMVSITPALQKFFREGPIFFVGDAAHTFPPLCAQGYNLGIQDALNLSWKIALSLKNQASEKLLHSYQKERQSIAKAIYKQNLFGAKLLTSHNAISGVFKTALLRFMRLLWYTEEKMHEEVGEFVFKYRKSPIIFNGGELAFAYLPILKNKKHLLIANRLSNKEKHLLDQKILSKYEHVLDYSIDEFPGEPSKILIIRPDQFIGFRSKNTNFRQLTRYLENTFAS